MRKLITILFIVFSVLSTSAQDYIDFDSVANYHTATGGIVFNQGQTYTYQNAHSQFIEKVESYLDSSDVQYYYLTDTGEGLDLHNNNNKVYELFLYVDSTANVLRGSPFIFGTDEEISQSSFEFYNYNLQIGDTVHSILFQSNGAPDFYVSDIDSVIIQGRNRRVFTYTKFGGNGSLEIFQGIGSEQGFLPGDYSFGETSQWLECVFFDNENESSYGDCFVSVIENNDKTLFFPNPFQDNLNIQFSEQVNGVLSIVDLQGKVCHQEKLNSVSRTINLASLQSRIYLLNVTNENGIVVAYQKIVKQ